MICPECGAEVQIVPDYNPLDDVLTREVRGSVEGATRQIQTGDIRRARRENITGNVNSTRVLSQGEMDRIREERRARIRRSGDPGRQNATGRNTGSMRRSAAGGTGVINRSSTGNVGAVKRGTTGRISQDPDERRRTSEERRRQQQMKRREAAKKKRRNVLLFLFFLLVLIGVGIYVIYQNSYTGVVNRGYDALQTDDYEEAQSLFNRAITKDRSRSGAYTGLAQVYMDQDDLEGAESVFLTALETQPSNAELYQAAIAFYVDTEQQNKISSLLQDCEDETVLNAVSDYVSEAPQFSLEEGTYSEVQEVAISSETGGTIYYTTDGTDPTESSTEYTEPILLQDEGETEIRAIAVNANGIPSVVASGIYTIEFPIVDAPAVTPATGQYTEPTKITITVPEGYTAYYTMDGSTPTSDSEKYTGPIDMPQNTQTIFSAILVNDNNGKATDVTTRNYITRSE